MKPFGFSLQSLRVLREQKERAAQRRYAEALRASEEAAARLDREARELAAAWTAMAGAVAGGVAAATLRQTGAWCAELERRCAQWTAALNSAERAAHEAWHDLVLATRQREVLDRLHEKCRHAYDRELRREEQKQLDEMGLRARDRHWPRPGRESRFSTSFFPLLTDNVTLP